MNELSFLMVGANVLLPLGVVLGHVCMPRSDDKTAATGAEESHIDEWPSGPPALGEAVWGEEG